MKNSVLLVVDVQKALIEEHPYNEYNVVANVKNMIIFCRQQGIEVIYVQHDDKEGDLAKGAYGWQIISEIEPKMNERIFDKEHNSAFYKTELNEYLLSKDIKNIILVGLQTEYCIDATCKSAFEHGFQVYIPEETNTTFDNDYLSGPKLYEFYNYEIWDNRFAKVLPIPQLKEFIMK